MKKILIFLLISAVVYASVEEFNEYDDVSLELSKDTHKTTVHLDRPHSTEKPASKPDSKTSSKPSSNPSSKPVPKTTINKPSIMKTKHPFKEIKGRLSELQKHMHNPRLPVEKIKKFIKDKAVKPFQELHHHVQNAIHWLHKNGYWKPIVKLAKTVAKPALTKLCSDHLPSFLCEPAIGFVFDHIK